jgi:hypothetical protein
MRSILLAAYALALACYPAAAACVQLKDKEIARVYVKPVQGTSTAAYVVFPHAKPDYFSVNLVDCYNFIDYGGDKNDLYCIMTSYEPWRYIQIRRKSDPIVREVDAKLCGFTTGARYSAQAPSALDRITPKSGAPAE